MALGDLFDPSLFSSPINPAAGPVPTLPPTQGFFGGLQQRLGQNLFPLAGGSAYGLNPQQLQDQRQQALKQFGLGMLSNVGTGRSFGAGLGGSFQLANNNLNQGLGEQYGIARQGRQEARQIEDQATEDARYTAAQTHQASREKITDARADAERADQLKHWSDQLQLSKQELAQRAVLAKQINPAEAAKLKIEADNHQRASELLAKPNRSDSDNLELDYLLKGAVSDMTKANPFGALGGLGGMPGAGANPLLSDPRL